MPAHADLHPQITRFAAEEFAELSTEQAAFVIGCSEDTVRRLCVRGKIEHGVIQGRGGYKIKHIITKAALLTWMIRNTQGPREVILAAIAQSCPQWSALAERVAADLPPIERPSNVIAFGQAPAKAKAKATILPFEHPDLFELPAKQQASA